MREYWNFGRFHTKMSERPGFRPARDDTAWGEIFSNTPKHLFKKKNKHICILKSEFIDLHACNKIRPRPTCFDGVFQCSATADQDVVQSRRFVLQLPVVHLKQLVRIMKINNFRFPVERLHYVGQ